MHLDLETIQAVEKALGERKRVELVLLQDGTVAAQAIERKRLKIEYDPQA